MNWPPNWIPVNDASTQQTLASELKRELCPEHALYGLSVTAIARRHKRDEVLFELHDGRVAVVHLTYHVESDKRWPSVDFYDSITAFLQQREDDEN